MNQLLGQLDRSLPGLTLALADVLGTKHQTDTTHLPGTEAKAATTQQRDQDLAGPF